MKQLNWPRRLVSLLRDTELADARRGLAIYSPTTAPDRIMGFKQIMENVRQRASRIETLKNVSVEVPMRLDHPYWRSDGEFGPEFHIRHIALPELGDWRQLCIQASRLHARPLDRARPM